MKKTPHQGSSRPSVMRRLQVVPAYFVQIRNSLQTGTLTQDCVKWNKNATIMKNGTDGWGKLHIGTRLQALIIIIKAMVHRKVSVITV